MPPMWPWSRCMAAKTNSPGSTTGFGIGAGAELAPSEVLMGDPFDRGAGCESGGGGGAGAGAGHRGVGPTMISPSCESTGVVLAKKRGARSTRVREPYEGSSGGIARAGVRGSTVVLSVEVQGVSQGEGAEPAPAPVTDGWGRR